MRNIQNKGFWRDPSLALLRKQREKYGGYLLNGRFEINGEGHYHFRAQFRRKEGDNINFKRALYALMNHVVKPVLLFVTMQRDSR